MRLVHRYVHEALLERRRVHDALVDRRHEESSVKLVFDELFDAGRLRPLLDFEVELRMLALVFKHEVRTHAVRHAIGKGDGVGAVFLLPVVFKRVLRSQIFVVDAFEMRVEHLTDFRRLDPGIRPRKKGNVELIFQYLNLSGQALLGNIEFCARLGDVLLLIETDE